MSGAVFIQVLLSQILSARRFFGGFVLCLVGLGFGQVVFAQENPGESPSIGSDVITDVSNMGVGPVRPEHKPVLETPPQDDLQSEGLVFKIATGPIGGTYFPVGETLAALISHPVGAQRCEDESRCGPSGMTSAAQNSLGSIRNIVAVSDGRVSSALAQADLVEAAFNSQGNFSSLEPQTNLRAIAHLFSEYVHVIANSEAGFSDFLQLDGKIVSVGAVGSGTRATAQALLKAAGVKPSQALDLSPYEAVDRLKAGEIDAFFFVGGLPVPFINDLMNSGDVALVPLVGPALTHYLKKQNALRLAVIPPETYSNVGPVETIAVAALWIVHEDISQERVYYITRALWNGANQDQLNMVLPGVNNAIEQALEGLTVPLHPGAERFYREAGLLGGDQIVPETGSLPE